MIESLLKLGKIKNALNHFDFMQVAFEKEMGITTTSAMREIQRRIQNYSTEKTDIDIRELDKKLDEKEKSGPLLCDAEYFRFLYNSHKRLRKEGQNPDYIILITLKDADDEHDLGVWNKLTTFVLDTTLRKGDVYTFWNDSQVLVMLSDVKEDGIQAIQNRVRKKYEDLEKSNLKIKIKSRQIEKGTSLI
jgi:hypothetical protein